MEINLDGDEIRSESAFHDAIAQAARSIGFEGYGRNLDALSDLLTGVLPRPLRIRWSDADVSRHAIGPRFDRLVETVREAERELGPSELQLAMEA
ncbi:MAG TPA: barstar family protein [Allosphingosinicella sp.]|jgi:RNAse (barnase) inhibitor barstar